MAQRGGAVDLWPRLDGATIPRGLTRCRVDGVGGLAMTGFDGAQFLDVGATSVVAAAANVDWGFGQPADLGVTDVNTFGVRWSGSSSSRSPGPTGCGCSPTTATGCGSTAPSG
ncbi:MAG: hypothetical protein IPL61_17185 [Myxococcales bacterium]|nr:hypothetical protein [Myxococcales bacterium]